jgi:hypothetical protein
MAKVDAANYLDQESALIVGSMPETLGLQNKDVLYSSKPSKTSSIPGDGAIFFAPVGDFRYGSNLGLLNWRGNVAECIQDGSDFWFAGGSFAGDASAAEPRRVRPDEIYQPYADVGLRLAFNWVGDSAQHLKLVAKNLKPVDLK